MRALPRASGLARPLGRKGDRELTASSPPDVLVRNIAIATDFSPWSDRATQHALLVARQFGAAVHFVHAVRRSEFALVPDMMVELERASTARLRRPETPADTRHTASIALRLAIGIWMVNSQKSSEISSMTIPSICWCWERGGEAVSQSSCRVNCTGDISLCLLSNSDGGSFVPPRQQTAASSQQGSLRYRSL